MPPRRLLAIALFAAGGAASAAPPAISLDSLKSVTRTLSSDEFEGRAPTTAGEDKTVAYIARSFAAAGLKPGGEHGGWYQDVPLVGITANSSTHLDIAGGKVPLRLAYRTDMVAAADRPSASVAVTGSDILFLGYGIDAPERNWNDFAGTDVRGKTIIVLVNEPDWQTPSDVGQFDGRKMTYYGRWTYKFEEAARKGAAAIFIVHDTRPAAYPFTVVQSSWTGTQYKLDGPERERTALVVGWLSKDAARRLLADSGKDLDRLTAAAARPGFRAIPLALTASISLESTIQHRVSRNVVGILPGRIRPNEYVLYTAHWDHFGHCTPVAGDDICNGAADNASGVAGLVALAGANAAAGPTARSQVYVALTAEEQGLLGSDYYAKHPLFALRDTVGGINMDILPLNGATRDITVLGRGKSGLDVFLARAAAAQGRRLTDDPEPEKGHYYRSDHFSFAKRGVPMLAASGGEDLVRGGRSAGKAADDDYVAHRYHQPSDEFDARWDWSGALQDLALYYAIGRDLGNGAAWPNWTKGDEFRAVRDRSRAGR